MTGFFNKYSFILSRADKNVILSQLFILYSLHCAFRNLQEWILLAKMMLKYLEK